MPLYVSDYLGDTSHLGAAEHGAYLLLIMHYWQKGGLPNDEQLLSRIARMSPEQWAYSRNIIADFFDANWRHGRIEEELAKAESISTKRSAAGKLGSDKRKANAEQPSSNSEAIADTRARVPQPQPHKELEASPLVNGTASPPDDEAMRKAIDRSDSDRVLLDRITDIYNPWAQRHGLPQVERLTGKRGVHCRRRISDLMEYGYETPEEAFRFLLSKCEQSFFIRGSPRSPLKFDQLLREDFMTQMLEGAFEKGKYRGEQEKWAS